ncbi:WYL domain-containing protein [Pediococcus pentosaceus]|uniref:helix-turn-helix transcriptional regulator n=1 Tax=Pediococcus pentosaceus TaxID=1255 RepID=UPI0007629533|nr:WYL domain-containing protein [Pediococcus pentosaceus]KAF0392665.1 WYL domain-containing protein [Pediococcus pentosaceus]KAF0433372.1 WYL domain-containing protein [Pediococcus pentosaceus]KAF0441534.1 WYL domain-containing protein [Pediococcus pentosaceus]MBF7108619.1 WYL domain-containing protein [Pediococcus pentosaceus]NEZ69013.1 WYL domain-containing protein [Pediococcus pentosaceus]
MKKSERLNQELIFLRDKYSFQLKDLITEFDISKRTALRDIQELEAMGLAYYTEPGRNGGYRLLNQSNLIPIYFNKKEVQAIFFALKALRVLSVTPFDESYARIQQKLFATMFPENQQDISNLLAVVHYHNVAPVGDIANLEIILNAILEEQVIQIHYTQYEDVHIQLQIYELFYRNGIWFTSAYNPDTQRWGTYRCDYMHDLKINPTKAPTLTLAELKALQDQYESTYHNIPFKCRLTPFGKELFLKHSYPNMHLEMIDGVPYIVGGYNQAELAYMTHYLVSFGKHLTIEAPEQLKNSYLKQLQAMIAKY